MKEQFPKVFFLAICVAIVTCAGCQEQELPSDKKSRAIAAENMQLKKELKQRDEKIEQLKKQYDKQLQQQQKQSAKCLKQKEALEKQLQKNVKDQVDDVLATVIDENTKLREEIKKLKEEN
jgi:nitrogen fixation/metabolism regulation signal transduction histidine kinase